MRTPEEIAESIEHMRRVAQSPKLQAVEVEKCKRDPWYWLENYAWTKDEHDSKRPFKRFPCKDYLKRITEVWQRERLLLIPKSRQMMISWLLVALYLHDAQFHPGRLIVYQSKKGEDATALIRRSLVIFDRQPSWMKQENRFREHPHGKLTFPAIESSIVGLPQGAEQLRSYTLSGLLVDEAAYQPLMQEAWTAAKPTIDAGDCRVTMVSSANPSFFEMLVSDRVEKAK